MLALTIAVLALVVAGYSAYLCRQVRDALAELADVSEAEDEEEESEAEDEREKRHLWVSDGELYVPDMPAFVEEIGALAVYTYDGCPQAVIPGKGVISLHKLLSEPSAKDVAPFKRVK